MDRTATSLTSSLAALTAEGRQRALHEEQERARQERRARVDSLVAENRRSRLDRQQSAALAEQQSADRHAELERAARARGRLAAAGDCERIAAEHAAQMRALTLAHELEEQKLVQQTQRRRSRGRSLLAAIVLMWIGIIVLMPDTQPTPIKQSVSTSQTAALTGAIASELPPTVDETSAELESAAVTTNTSEPQTRSSNLSPARSSAESPTRSPIATTRQPTKPAPLPAAPTCDDHSGDPCCAFGQIMC